MKIKTQPTPSHSIGWIHLSDFHAGAPGRPDWSTVKTRLMSDLASLRGVCGPWDLLFLTGDLTYSGHRQEFDLLSDMLEELLGELRNNLDSDPIVLAVPGNHDLARFVGVSADDWQALVGSRSRKNIEQIISRDTTRSMVNTAFASYTEWWSALQKRQMRRRNSRDTRALTFQDGYLPGDFAATVDVCGWRVGVVGLNSAVLQLTNRRMSALVIPGQVPQGVRSDKEGWRKSHTVCLLLTHHPSAAFSGTDEKRLFGEVLGEDLYDAHLCGHQHRASSLAEAKGGGPTHHQWQASSLFGTMACPKGRRAPPGLDGPTRAQDIRRRIHGLTLGRFELPPQRRPIEQHLVYYRMWPRRACQGEDGQWRLGPDWPDNDVDARDGGMPNKDRSRRFKPCFASRIDATNWPDSDYLTFHVTRSPGAKLAHWQVGHLALDLTRLPLVDGFQYDRDERSRGPQPIWEETFTVAGTLYLQADQTRTLVLYATIERCERDIRDAYVAYFHRFTPGEVAVGTWAGVTRSKKGLTCAPYVLVPFSKRTQYANGGALVSLVKEAFRRFPAGLGLLPLDARWPPTIDKTIRHLFKESSRREERTTPKALGTSEGALRCQREK